MSNNTNDITHALAGDGDYDQLKATELKNNMVGTFTAMLRKVERTYWGYMCLCSWLFVFALYHFFHSSGAKALLFYGILMIVFFEAIVLMKLWYWIANQKISVLKAIKQLALGEASATSAATSPQDTIRPVEGLSRRERIIWKAALLAGCALIAAIKTVELGGVENPWGFEAGSRSTSHGSIALAANGSGSAVTELSFLHQGTLPGHGFSFHAPQSEKLRFVDSSGQELPFTTSPQREHVRYDVRLPRLVMPGERFNYERHAESSQAATEEDGVWTYASDVAYGYNTNEISQTVVLPAGAEIVSTSPWPVASFTLQDRPTVRFTGVRASNEPFKYTVKYRLAPRSPE